MKNIKYTVLLTGAAVLFGAGTAFAAVNDYTNHYTFDEGTGRNVGDSAGRQNGFFVGTSTGFGWASGQVGTALGMDGMQGESVALPDGFLSGSAGSIVLWFKVNSLTDRNILFSARSTINSYIYEALRINYEGRMEFVFRSSQDGADQKVQGAGTLNKNEWYQLVFTANSVGYHMFINGEEVSIAGYNIGRWFSDLTTHTLTYHVGALDSSPLSGVFDGYLDDLRIYHRALTQEDVTTLYNGGSPGIPGIPLAAKQALVATSTPSANLAADASVPVTIVMLGTTTPQAPTTTLGVNATSSTLVMTKATPELVTSLPVATTLSPDATRKAVIQKLIDQILLLIAELQKQLAALKAQGSPTVTGASY